MNLEQQKQAIIEQYGEWTAHNIHLTGDTYTIANAIVGDEVKLRRITQMVADFAQKPLQDLRILDLACLEGLYGIELARQGATVVGIEGRKPNIAKAKFAQEALALDNLTLIHDDVRNLNIEQHGCFDVVLCLGILYHLEVPDIFVFLERLSAVCTGFAVIDTHVGAMAERSHLHNGHTYWGSNYQEHAPDTSLDERAKSLWSSLDNPTSFWFTRPSLYNILAHLGFTTICECYYPLELNKASDRLTLLAIKGQTQSLKCAPLMAHEPMLNMPEQPIPASPAAAPPAPVAAPTSAAGVKSYVKRFVRSLLSRN
jgi:hypothetical protein